jgi:F-type H+-transporting ATPase subunit delta
MDRLSVIYATAIFDLALKHDAVDEFFNQAVYLRDSLGDFDCQRMLVHPQIPAAEKHDFFRRAFEGQIHSDLLGFMYLAVDKNRVASLIPALKLLIGMIEKHNNIVTARILSASPYSDDQAQSLKSMLSKKLEKHVELNMDVDPSLIGGPYIFVDGYYIDWTVKKKLQDLTSGLKENKLSN